MAPNLWFTGSPHQSGDGGCHQAIRSIQGASKGIKSPSTCVSGEGEGLLGLKRLLQKPLIGLEYGIIRSSSSCTAGRGSDNIGTRSSAT